MNPTHISYFTWETSLRDINSLWVPHLNYLLFPYFEKGLHNLDQYLGCFKFRRASLPPHTHTHIKLRCVIRLLYPSNFIVCTHLIPVPSSCIDLSYFSKGEKKWPQTRNQIRNLTSLEFQLKKKPEERDVHFWDSFLELPKVDS